MKKKIKAFIICVVIFAAGFAGGFILRSLRSDGGGKTSEQWKAAYKNYLLDNYDALTSDSVNPRFTFAYIDSDNIPEVLVFEGDWNTAQVRVLTYSDGTVNDAGCLGAKGAMNYSEKSGLITETDLLNGNVYESHFRMDDGKVELLWSGKKLMSSDSNGEPSFRCYIDDAEVTLQEYDAKENEDSELVFETCSYSDADNYSFTKEIINNLESIKK